MGRGGVRDFAPLPLFRRAALGEPPLLPSVLCFFPFSNIQISLSLIGPKEEGIEISVVVGLRVFPLRSMGNVLLGEPRAGGTMAVSTPLGRQEE